MLNESIIFRKLRHPNIVCLMAYAKDTRFHYLVTSYISGGNLDEIIFVRVERTKNVAIDTVVTCLFQKEEAITFSDVVKFAEKMASALAYMHGQQPPLVHRDLKPANVLVSMISIYCSGYLTNVLIRLIRGRKTCTCATWAWQGSSCTRKRAWGSLLTTVEVTSLLLQSVTPTMLQDVQGPMQS